MDPVLRSLILAAQKSPAAAASVAKRLSESSIASRYLMQTSQAVDLISGGVKINALPEKVSAVVNHRIAVESLTSDVRSRLISVLTSKIISKYPLALDAWGSISGNTSSSSAGTIRLSDFNEPLEPSPISPYDSNSYKIFSGTSKSVFGEDVIVAPSLMTGNTDTKFYWNLSRNIYRFSPVREGGRVGAHTVDERMGMKEHVEGVRFYTTLVLNGDR
jgi:Gly-Xaa carboxypeptidase